MPQFNKKIKSFQDLKDVLEMSDQDATFGSSEKSSGILSDKLTYGDYEKMLANETELDHNPNPFDFVFFADRPNLYSKAELDKLGDLVSGYLEVELKALTPVHIVGRQDPETGKEGRKILKSYFYREDGKPCIPGSSIRGMLRSFIEALTNGWVSEANEEYEKQRGDRHIGFKSFENYENLFTKRKIKALIHSAIPSVYKPKFQINESDKLDIATFLFGYVTTEKEVGKVRALKGKVVIEDAMINENNISFGNELPDIEDEAFMGGPNPRANSWWYFKPYQVRERWVRAAGRAFSVADFVGREYWGRKFYFHQYPEPCIEFYLKEENGKKISQWANMFSQEDNIDIRDRKKLLEKLYRYEVEVFKTENTCCFRVYIRSLPEKLFRLLCLALCPGNTIRHKLGYGKPFGFGSVEFSIKKAMLRKEKSSDWPDKLKDEFETIHNWLNESWKAEEIKEFIDEEVLKRFAQILGWPPINGVVFSYPPFYGKYFRHPVSWQNEFQTIANKLRLSPSGGGRIYAVNEGEGIRIAQEMWDNKKTIHFQLYQARAKGFKQILSRKP
ncbi:MAG: RAMP superfamily CRISPR-associated protein [Candidatus Jordarchaeaceae archaeon]